jgi:hypothetical protein
MNIDSGANEKDKQDRAAEKICSFLKMVSKRKKYLQYLQEKAEYIAALIIQKNIRGFLTRKKIMPLMKEILQEISLLRTEDEFSLSNIYSKSNTLLQDCFDNSEYKIESIFNDEKDCPEQLQPAEPRNLSSDLALNCLQVQKSGSPFLKNLKPMEEKEEPQETNSIKDSNFKRIEQSVKNYYKKSPGATQEYKEIKSILTNYDKEVQKSLNDFKASCSKKRKGAQKEQGRESPTKEQSPKELNFFTQMNNPVNTPKLGEKHVKHFSQMNIKNEFLHSDYYKYSPKQLTRLAKQELEPKQNKQTLPRDKSKGVSIPKSSHLSLHKPSKVNKPTKSVSSKARSVMKQKAKPKAGSKKRATNKRSNKEGPIRKSQQSESKTSMLLCEKELLPPAQSSIMESINSQLQQIQSKYISSGNYLSSQKRTTKKLTALTSINDQNKISSYTDSIEPPVPFEYPNAFKKRKHTESLNRPPNFPEQGVEAPLYRFKEFLGEKQPKHKTSLPNSNLPEKNFSISNLQTDQTGSRDDTILNIIINENQREISNQINSEPETKKVLIESNLSSHEVITQRISDLHESQETSHINDKIEKLCDSLLPQSSLKKESPTPELTPAKVTSPIVKEKVFGRPEPKQLGERLPNSRSQQVLPKVKTQGTPCNKWLFGKFSQNIKKISNRPNSQQKKAPFKRKLNLKQRLKKCISLKRTVNPARSASSSSSSNSDSSNSSDSESSSSNSAKSKQ